MKKSLAVALLCVAAQACGPDRPQRAESGTSGTPAPEVQQSPGHAAPAVTPGSYEDWCEEHGVPETMCTRCDPALAAAFKATGDWCAEHGLPESQCLACNPDLKIVRPPKPEGK
jgi:hypothetical protein